MARLLAGNGGEWSDDREVPLRVELESAPPHVVPAVSERLGRNDESPGEKIATRIARRLHVGRIQARAQQILHVTDRSLVRLRFAVADQLARGVERPHVWRTEHLQESHQAVHAFVGGPEVADRPAAFLGSIQLLEDLSEIFGVFGNDVGAYLLIPDVGVTEEPEGRQVAVNGDSVEVVVEDTARASVRVARDRRQVRVVLRRVAGQIGREVRHLGLDELRRNQVADWTPADVDQIRQIAARYDHLQSRAVVRVRDDGHVDRGVECLLDFLPGGVLIARRRRGIVRGHEHVQRAAAAGRPAGPRFWRIFGIAQEPIRNARVSAVKVRLWAAGRWDVCRE